MHYIYKMRFRFPKTPLLLRYRTQPRRDLPPSPAAATSPPSRSAIAGGFPWLADTALTRKHENIPAASAFITTTSGALGQSRAGFDGQCGHILRLKAVLQLAERQREVELARLQLLVVADGRDNVVEIHFVGVADEARRVLLQYVGNLNGVGVFL